METSSGLQVSNLGSYRKSFLLRFILGDPGAVSWVSKNEKFSRMGERAPGMLLLTNQFHDLFECLFVDCLCPIRGKNLSRGFRDLLIRRS